MEIKLWTEQEAASALGLKNPRTLTEWRRRRQGPAFVKIGSNVRYRPEDISAFIAARRVDPTASPSPAAI